MNKVLELDLGPVMVDVEAFSLSPDEINKLSHPNVGGVILFRRNFKDLEQLASLCAQIKAIRTPSLLIAVDHEGGRVQRFIPGFTHLPPMQMLGELFDQDASNALALAKDTGEVLAIELTALGLDLSFTPVLDLDYGQCPAIGNRSFHRDPQVVIQLASALLEGLALGGMSSCGKHFPGHGFVSADSHLEMPVDERDLDTLMRDDIQPFMNMIKRGLGSIMPAHVLFPNIDAKAAGFSEFWLQTILRQKLQFEGIIFSDDLGMEGAATAGSFVQRASLALQAGCDMVLVCNQPARAWEVVLGLETQHAPQLNQRLASMHARLSVAQAQAHQQTDAFRAKQAKVKALSLPKTMLSGPQVGEAY